MSIEIEFLSKFNDFLKCFSQGEWESLNISVPGFPDDENVDDERMTRLLNML